MRKLVGRFVSTTFLVALISLGSLPASSANTTVSITNVGFNLDTDVVPDNLVWSKKSIALATKAQGNLYRTIKAQLSYLRTRGAVRVVRIRHNTDSGVRNWNKLGVDKYLYHLEGYDSEGELVASMETLFELSHGVQARTVYLGQDECIFRPFNFFDVGTWFTQQCSITVESKQKFLRSAMQSWVTEAGGYRPDSLAIAEELKVIASQHLSFKIENNIFKCLGCHVYMETPYSSFAMEFSGGLWPYKIVYDPKSGRFAMNVMKPNYRDLMNNVRLVADDTLLFTPWESEIPEFVFVPLKNY